MICFDGTHNVFHMVHYPLWVYSTSSSYRCWRTNNLACVHVFFVDVIFIVCVVSPFLCWFTILFGEACLSCELECSDTPSFATVQSAEGEEHEVR